MSRLVLASGSPRRRELLARLGVEFEVVHPDIDESVRRGETPVEYVCRLAAEKADAVAAHLAGSAPVAGITTGITPGATPGITGGVDAHIDEVDTHVDAVVLAADTTVDVDGQILGKPVDRDDACSMLRTLSGRTHQVHTAVAVRRGADSAHEVVTSDVTFAPLTASRIEWYVDTGEPLDKAGAYAVQGKGAVLVERVRGSTTNVVGLPLRAVMRLLRRAMPELGPLQLDGKPGGGVGTPRS
jgi:septum formation protein